MTLERSATPDATTQLVPVDFGKISKDSPYFSMMQRAHRKFEILQPAGEEYCDYAEKILAGKWLEMDYLNPEAIRHVYKVCAEGLISADELVTAILLLNANSGFAVENGKTSIKQYRFDDTAGPYDYTKIHYAKKANIDNFKNRLLKLKDNERCYFEINLSHRDAMIFLMDGYVQELDKSSFEKYNKILEAYLTVLAVNDEKKARLLKLSKEKTFSKTFSKSKCKCKHCQIKNDEFFDVVMANNPEVVSYLDIMRGNRNRERERDSILLLAQISKLKDELPGFQLASDFDASNPKTPLLSIIVLTMSAFKALNLAMHGKDATMPFYCVGKIPVNMIRACDETNQTRPIELPYPGVLSDDTPHQYTSNNFMITWHDLYHIWRNSSNPYKDFCRASRQFLQREKGSYMSKMIWEFTDMDFDNGCDIRSANDALSKLIHAEAFLKTLFEYFFEFEVAGNYRRFKTENQNYLLVIDLIKNPEAWNKVCHGIDVKEVLFEGVEQAKVAYEIFYPFVMKDPPAVRNKLSSTDYIVRYVLRQLEYTDKLCDELSQTDIIRWQRNGDLMIQAFYTSDNKAIVLYDLIGDKDRTYDVIRFAMNKYKKNLTDVKIENNDARDRLDSYIIYNGQYSGLKKKSAGTYNMSMFFVSECFRKIGKARDLYAKVEEKVSSPRL
jgi:hypothetical protein